MTDTMVVIEKEITVDLKVEMTDISVNFDAQEVVILVPTALAGPGGTGGVTSIVWSPVGPGTVVPVNGQAYDVDTTPSAANFPLPMAPVDGFAFLIRDANGTFATNFCNLIPAVGSGHQIIQTGAPEETLSLNYSHQSVGFLIRFRAIDQVWTW